MRKRSSTLTSVAIAGVWAAAGIGHVVAAAAPATPIRMKKLRRETLPRTPSSLVVSLGIVASLDRVCLLLTSLIRVGSCGVSSFDHLVGAQHYRWGYGKPERRGGLAVHDHLELGRQLHREIVRLLAAQNAIYRGGGLTIDVYEVGSIGEQTA